MRHEDNLAEVAGRIRLVSVRRAPIQVNAALEFHYRGKGFREQHTPAGKAATENLLAAGLIEEHPHFGSTAYAGPRYVPTEGLKIYVEALCKVPFPKKITMWSMPK